MAADGQKLQQGVAFEYAEIFTHRGWHEVAESPELFLRLGLVTEGWLSISLPILLEARDSVQTSGASLTHFDVRSDNLCFRGSQVILIDWNNACLGNGELDVAFWLPSLRHEGGPEPKEILPGAGHLASYVTGYFASRAGLPDLPHTPLVRQLQRQQLEICLPWVIEELGLPSLKTTMD